MATAARREGSVSSFDDAAGLGTISDGEGTVIEFHCTRIADGSRSIRPGVPVTFELVPGHRGRWEASDIRPRPGPGRGAQSEVPDLPLSST